MTKKELKDLQDKMNHDSAFFNEEQMMGKYVIKYKNYFDSDYKIQRVREVYYTNLIKLEDFSRTEFRNIIEVLNPDDYPEYFI